MKVCPICGFQTDDSKKFCGNCGSPFENDMIVDEFDKTVAAEGIYSQNIPVGVVNDEVHTDTEPVTEGVENNAVENEAPAEVPQSDPFDATVGVGGEMPYVASASNFVGGNMDAGSYIPPQTFDDYKAPKKGNKRGLLIVVAAFVAVLVVVVAGLLTDWFGFVRPVPKIIRAAAKTLNEKSFTVKTTTSYTASSDSVNKNSQEMMFVADEKKKQVTTMSEQDDYQRLYHKGDTYSYVDYGDGDEYAYMYEGDDEEDEKFFEFRELVGNGRNIDYPGIVELFELEELIDPNDVDEFIDEAFDKYLNDRKWLKNTAGYKKQGKAYTFSPDIEEVLNDFMDLVDDSDAFEDEAKEELRDKIDYIIDSLADYEVTLDISVILKGGYISEIEIMIEGEDGEYEKMNLEFTDYKKTKINEDDIKDFKNKVEKYIEENSCADCGEEYAPYEYDGKKYCWDCYDEYGGCDFCSDSDDSYYYDGYDLCWDCYYDLKYGGCDLCSDSDDSYYYDGYDLCWDCYYDLKYN